MSGGNLIERATKLELTDVEARESSVRGRFGGVLVDLDGANSELKFTFFLERPVSWKQISLKISEINDPDIVVTEDQPFDDSITVEAHDGAAPTVSHVFKDADVRAKTLDLFAQFHEASFSRNKLVIARVPLEGAAAQRALLAGSQLVEALKRAIDSTGASPREPQPVLADTGRWSNESERRWAVSAVIAGTIAFGLLGTLVTLVGLSEGPVRLALVLVAVVAVWALTRRRP